MTSEPLWAEQIRQAAETQARWTQSIRDFLHAEHGPIPEVQLFGQEAARLQLEPFLNGKTPPTLLLGEPGVGKTHMARWMAFRKNVPILESLSPVTPEMAPAYGVWLLDEVHRQTKPEPLFSLMEQDYSLLTIVGATTRPDKLDPAFRSRFFLQVYLEALDEKARKDFIRHMLPDIMEDHLIVLAQASAGNPRQAERLVATAKALGSSHPEDVLPATRINADGLDDVQLKILTAMGRINRPIGLSTLANIVRCDEQTVADKERLLLDLGLIELAKSGRTLTKLGKDYARVLAGQP